MVDQRNDGNIAAKDQARTPPEIFRKLDAEFHFLLDASCTTKNCLTTRGIFHDTGHDALEIKWHGELDYNEFLKKYEPVFINPPYSTGNILKFAHKAWLESAKGATVVLLIPSDPSTQYFEFCFENASEIRFMIPRVKFNNPDGTPMKGTPTTGSMIVVFRPGEEGPAKCSLWRWKEDAQTNRA